MKKKRSVWIVCSCANNLLPIDFNNILTDSFISVKKDKNYREIIGENFSIDFYLTEENVSNIMVSVNGEKGLFKLVEIAKKYSLQVFDTSIDKFIDLDNPELNGYNNFQNYLKKIKNE